MKRAGGQAQELNRRIGADWFASIIAILWMSYCLPAAAQSGAAWVGGGPADDGCWPGPGPLNPPSPYCDVPCVCESCSPDDPNYLDPGDASDWGDPHVVTFDQVAYEFQQVGEYVLISNGGDFVVQKRSVAFNGSSTIAGNQAIAVNIAGDRVGVYYGAAEPLLINGFPAGVPANIGIFLPHGGRLTLLLLIRSCGQA